MADLQKFCEKIKGFKDPELPFTFGQLGMFQGARDDSGTLEVTFAFTTSKCPHRSDIESTIEMISQLAGFQVHRLVEVPWSIDMAQEELRFELVGAAAQKNLTHISNAI